MWKHFSFVLMADNMVSDNRIYLLTLRKKMLGFFLHFSTNINMGITHIYLSLFSETSRVLIVFVSNLQTFNDPTDPQKCCLYAEIC